MYVIDSKDQMFFPKTTGEMSEIITKLFRFGYKAEDITVTILKGETITHRFTMAKPTAMPSNMDEEKRVFSAM